jgi:NitT/TauT family transport system permease protein
MAKETMKARSLSAVRNLLLQRISKNRLLLLSLSLLVFLLLWQILVLALKLPSFILPSPAEVGKKFLDVLASGMLWRHFSATLKEILLGLIFGVSAAALLGYGLSKSPIAERMLSPFLVGSQSIPMAAVAPLLVIWFGPGLLSKVLICSLTVFFPVLVNTLVGLRDVPQDLREVMRSLRSSPAQTLRYLEIPAALPVFLGGLRVGASLSVIGAIVGELVASDQGLGFLINVGRGQYDTALVFVAVICLVVLAASLYGFVLLLEKKLLSWQTWRKEN